MSQVSGTSGTSGSSGTTGATSTSGSSTVSGTSGTSGSNGTSGAATTSGNSSASGTSGTSGSSGTSGLSFNGTSGISGGSFVNQPDYLVRTTGTTTIQSVSFLYADITNTRLGINTNGPTRTLDVNGSISANSEYFLYTSNDLALTVGDIDRGSTTIGPLLPGVTTLTTKLTANSGGEAQGTILVGQQSASGMTAGQLVYFIGASSTWGLADADATTTSIDLIGITLTTVGGASQEIAVLIDGVVSSDFATVGNAGDPIFVSQTAGNVTTTVPTATGSIVRGVGNIIGINGATSLIHFHPDTTYFTNG
jgi:hypothetical protein